MKKNKKKFLKPKIERFKKFLKNVWEILCRPQMAVLPGQLAFFMILSLVPIITLIGYGASCLNLSMDSLIELLKDNFSTGVTDLIIPIISGHSIDIKLLIILIIMFYLSSNGAASMIVTSNEIYGQKQSSWIKRRLKAIILTFVIVILFLFILLVPVFGNKIIDAIDFFNIKSLITSILSVLQGPISWIIIFIFIKIIFVLAPDKKIHSSRTTIGAIFTTIGWVLATELYSFYISHFAVYDLFYAGLSNIAILMLWFYFLAYILVVGLSLTTKLEDEELEKTGSIKIIK